MTRGLFVTGTDTGVGKSLVAAGLMLRLRRDGRRVAGLKPVASGCERTPDGLRNDDALLLQRCASEAWPYAAVNPFAFEPAIAPHLAAAEAGIRPDVATLAAAAAGLAGRCDTLVVEGAGGWLVPLNERESLADLAVALGFDVVLAVGIRLGCISHALLTAEAIRARGLRLAGWVANAGLGETERGAEQIASIAARIGAPCLATLPRIPDADPERVADALEAPFR